MRIHALSARLRHSSDFGHRPPRFAPWCATLEPRQLLSTGQSPVTGVLQASHGAISTAATTGSAEVSNPAITATALGAPGGASGSAAGNLSQLVNTSEPISPSGGSVSVTGTLDAGPAFAASGAPLALTDLSVTALNPDMTSTTAAVIDTQVDADAYLIPSSSDLLDDHLGVSTLSSALHSNTAASANTDATAFMALDQNRGRAVSKFGQSAPAPPGMNWSGSSSAEFGEPPAVTPGGGGAAQGQPSPPASGTVPANPAQAPTVPAAQAPPAPSDESSQEDKPATQPSGPPSTPAGEQAPTESAASARGRAADTDPAVDAVLAMTDFRLRSRYRGREFLQGVDGLSGLDRSSSLSAALGATIAVAGGYRIAAGNFVSVRQKRWPVRRPDCRKQS